jgi:hypothetical protein
VAVTARTGFDSAAAATMNARRLAGAVISTGIST